VTGVVNDRATVTMFIDVSPADAFEVFTTEIDLWWRHGPQYRTAGKLPSVFKLEPRVGGKLTETSFRDAGERTRDAGTVTVWDPPDHLAFEWRGATFVDDEKTVVDVRFVASGSGTRVTLVHGGWASLRDDHPVRHGKPLGKFLADIGMWWAGLLRSLAERATSRGAP
jgi:hypothetical protein